MFSSYTSACTELRNCEFEKTDLCKIVVCKGDDSDDFDITVKLSNDDETVLHPTDLVMWSDLIDLDVDNQADVEEENALAHILYDITFILSDR